MGETLASRSQLARDPVRVEVTAQQEHLEEKHAGGPYRRASAVPGKDETCQKRLDKEQKDGAQNDSTGISNHGPVFYDVMTR